MIETIRSVRLDVSPLGARGLHAGSNHGRSNQRYLQLWNGGDMTPSDRDNAGCRVSCSIRLGGHEDAIDYARRAPDSRLSSSRRRSRSVVPDPPGRYPRHRRTKRLRQDDVVAVDPPTDSATPGHHRTRSGIGRQLRPAARSVGHDASDHRARSRAHGMHGESRRAAAHAQNGSRRRPERVGAS